MIAGRYGTGDARRAVLGDKYASVQARVNELMGAKGTGVSSSSGGGAGLVSGEYKMVCDSLNVRSAPSTGASAVASYSRGDRIYSVASDTVAADGYVWAHYVAYSGVTRYVAVGTTDGSEKYLVKA